MSVISSSTDFLITGGVFLIAFSGAVYSARLFEIIRMEVNAKLPDQARIDAVGATPFTFRRVERLHRELYPKSKMVRTMNWTIILTIVMALILLWRVGAVGFPP
jgi:hypothetical protein